MELKTAMNNCYAICMKNCSKEMSREHLISDSILNGNRVIVKGLKWCKDSAVTIGHNSLVSRILCKKHNSQLSIYDEEGKRFIDSLREVNNLISIWNKNKIKIYNVYEKRISGYILEKWFLKTAINMCLTEGYNGFNSHKGGFTLKELCFFLFTDTVIPEFSGLYFVSCDNGLTDYESDFVMEVTYHNQDYINGFLFKIYGFQFFIYFDKLFLPKVLKKDIIFDNKNLNNFHFNYRNKKIEFNYFGKIAYRIKFIWN